MIHNRKLELEYPCSWQYKAIGRDRTLLEEAICSVFSDCKCDIRYSNSSKTGKYHSFSIELIIHNEESRLEYYKQLQASSPVMMVL